MRTVIASDPSVSVEVAEIGSRDTPRRAETWRVYGVETDIVGRKREFEKILDIFRKSIETSTCHLVMLTGPEGIGKSRLVAELNEQLDKLFDAGHLVAGACRETNGPPYAVFSRGCRWSSGFKVFLRFTGCF
jgi:Cdc6-like AAA superfamily ATPase